MLTERVDYGGDHSGEVSLPGGKVDPGDADAAATALREARGGGRARSWNGDGVEVIGALDALWIPPTQLPGRADRGDRRAPAAVRPGPREVAAILEAPVTAFLPDVAPVIIDPDPRPAAPLRRVHGGGRIVWGATAAILGQFGAVLGR